jgi:hypothetical protein
MINMYYRFISILSTFYLNIQTIILQAIIINFFSFKLFNRFTLINHKFSINFLLYDLLFTCDHYIIIFRVNEYD